MKNLLLFIFITLSVRAFGQIVPQIQLNTSTYQPSAFTPSPYTPQQPDLSILQRSLQRREERANKSYELYNQLIELYIEIEKSMPPTESDWYRAYAGEICSNVKDYIDSGDYGIAITMAYEAMSTLRNDKQIVFRIDSYKQYCEDMRNHGFYNYEKGLVSQTAYEWFCINNQYKFTPKYDHLNNLIGYQPVCVSYLYPSVNWQELNQYLTSQNRTKEDIEKLWSIYFNHNPDRRSSLIQEFEVTKFCLDYLISKYNSPDIRQTERENLQNNINAYRATLSDANGEISYNAFVENIKKQYVVQPSRVQQKSAPPKKTKRNSRLK